MYNIHGLDIMYTIIVHIYIVCLFHAIYKKILPIQIVLVSNEENSTKVERNYRFNLIMMDGPMKYELTEHDGSG